MTYTTRADAVGRDNTREGFRMARRRRGLSLRLDEAAAPMFSSLQVEMPSRRWFKQASRALDLGELAAT